MTEITGKTRVLGIIGWPVAHSLSPLMQNAALQALGMDYIYVPFPVTPEALPVAVLGLRSLGVAGFNVTIPHKTTIIPLLDELTPEAAFIGAVNTVRREGDQLIGDNTDGIGFVRSLAEDLEFQPQGKTILLLGAGGAARSALVSLCAAGAAEIIIANRTIENADALIEGVADRYSQVRLSTVTLDSVGVDQYLPVADLVVNTTSVGMGGSSFDWLDLSLLQKGGRVYDMVYSPPLTPLLVKAKGAGHSYANGIGMLIAQGEEAFRLWTGAPPPPGVMKTRLRALLDK